MPHRIWECNHCDATSDKLTKEFLEHELCCPHNPENHNCHTCRFSFRIEIGAVDCSKGYGTPWDACCLKWEARKR